VFETFLTRKLNIRYPIFQAPMAGGPTTPDLVAAVSNAGGLGNLGAGYLTPEQLRNTINKIRELTDRPFGVNLFVFEQPEESEEETIEEMSDYLNFYRNELGIQQNPSLQKYSESFEEQVQVVLEERVPVFSFTFGIPSTDVFQRMKQRGTFVIGTATTVDEAIQLEASGADAIVAQGSEAGGHRGTFLKNVSISLIGLIALVPQIVDHVSVPVIASGGGHGWTRASSQSVIGSISRSNGYCFFGLYGKRSTSNVQTKNSFGKRGYHRNYVCLLWQSSKGHSNKIYT